MVRVTQVRSSGGSVAVLAEVTGRGARGGGDPAAAPRAGGSLGHLRSGWGGPITDPLEPPGGGGARRERREWLFSTQDRVGIARRRAVAVPLRAYR